MANQTVTSVIRIPLNWKYNCMDVAFRVGVWATSNYNVLTNQAGYKATLSAFCLNVGVWWFEAITHWDLIKH